MSRDHRLRLVATVTGVLCTIIFVQAPIAQDPSYHQFADERDILGLPNGLNVLTNLLFVLTGVMGLMKVARWSRQSRVFLRPSESVPYAVLFGGVLLTGLGSAYYHVAPNTPSLFWDRLPMSVIFMAYLATAIMERIDQRTGLITLFPLVAYGLFSVIYWRVTEQSGEGDLRYYIIAQLLPVILVALMIRLLPSAYSRGADLYVVTCLYLLAKLCEVGDVAIYQIGSIISGHSLKHVAAATAAAWILRMLQRRERLPSRWLVAC